MEKKLRVEGWELKAESAALEDSKLSTLN